jgi:hypothetical protein
MACATITINPVASCPVNCNPTLQKCDSGTDYQCACASPCPSGYECTSGSTICTLAPTPYFVYVSPIIVSPTQLIVGQAFTVTQSVRNTGTAQGQTEVVFTVDGVPYTEYTGSITPGGTGSASATFTASSAGILTVCGMAPAPCIDVTVTEVQTEEPVFTIDADTFSVPTEVTPGSTITASVVVYNIGNAPGLVTIIFNMQVPGGQTLTAYGTASIAVGGSATVSATFTAPAEETTLTLTSGFEGSAPVGSGQVAVTEQATPVSFGILAVLGLGLIGGFIVFGNKDTLKSDSGGKLL